MEIKKSSVHDLERSRTTFFLCGLVVALTLFYVALEWGTDAQDDDEDVKRELRHLTKELDMIPLMKETPKVIPHRDKVEEQKVEDIKVADELQQLEARQETEVKQPRKKESRLLGNVLRTEITMVRLPLNTMSAISRSILGQKITAH